MVFRIIIKLDPRKWLTTTRIGCKKPKNEIMLNIVKDVKKSG